MWSLGCVVYELMSHVPPFEAPELSYKVITCQPSPLPSCYSKELCETVFERMLKKDPELRCSAQELMKVTDYHPTLALRQVIVSNDCSLLTVLNRSHM